MWVVVFQAHCGEVRSIWIPSHPILVLFLLLFLLFVLLLLFLDSPARLRSMLKIDLAQLARLEAPGHQG